MARDLFRQAAPAAAFDRAFFGNAEQPPDTVLGFCPACCRVRWITDAGICTQCLREAGQRGE
jgi:hypothetical protein